MVWSDYFLRRSDLVGPGADKKRFAQATRSDATLISSPETTSTRANASVAVSDHVPSVSAIVIALAAAQLIVAYGSCGGVIIAAAATAPMLLSSPLRPCLLIPNSFPSLLPSYLKAR